MKQDTSSKRRFVTLGSWLRKSLESESQTVLFRCSDISNSESPAFAVELCVLLQIRENTSTVEGAAGEQLVMA